MKCGFTIFMALLIAPTITTNAQQRVQADAPGKLIQIGNHTMHLIVTGPPTSPVTVVFESGGGGYSEDWSKVRENLSPDIRSVAYDRAGMGWSEAGPSPRTMHQEVFELHELLEREHMKGPIILVGQSLGGLIARIYAEQYGDDVAGMVLVDPTHESSVLANVRYGGWVRLREKAGNREIPKPVLEGTVKTVYDPNEDYMAEEFNQLYLSRKAHPHSTGHASINCNWRGETTDAAWHHRQPMERTST